MTDRELTDDELLQIWESTTAGVRDGTIPTFSDKASLVEHIRQRLGKGASVVTERSLEGIYTGPPVEMPPRKEDCNCACGIKDEYGRYPIGRCGDDCERKP